MMTKRIGLAAALLAGLLGMGCSKDYEVDVIVESNPPPQTDVAPEGIELVEGTAVAFTIIPLENDELMDWDTHVELRPMDAGIARVSPLDYDLAAQEAKDKEDREGDWGFMLRARLQGSTTLVVTIDGDHEVEIPARVLPFVAE